MDRRKFLQSLTAAGLALPPSIDLSAQSLQSNVGNRPRHLILIELAGGNDGLNTVIPYRNSNYRKLRPNLGIPTSRVLQLDERHGLHPSLEPLMSSWNNKHMAIINGVGYPHPNRSHFRSIEIWETASASDETLLDGWLKPVMQKLSESGYGGVQAVALAEDQGPLAGTDKATIVFKNLKQFINQSRTLRKQSALTNNDSLRHILNVQQQTQATALQFAESVSTNNTEQADYPNSPLATQLKTVAELIASQAGPRVYKVGMASFDTHQNQLNKHANLLRQLGSSINAFQKSMQNIGLWNDVLIMTYSEFGRRAGENGSGGTDHGTAAPQFVFGGSVKGGIYGEQPSLENLENDDLVYNTDFRSLYRTIAENWLSATDDSGRYSGFDKLPLI